MDLSFGQSSLNCQQFWTKYVHFPHNIQRAVKHFIDMAKVNDLNLKKNILWTPIQCEGCQKLTETPINLKMVSN